MGTRARKTASPSLYAVLGHDPAKRNDHASPDDHSIRRTFHRPTISGTFTAVLNSKRGGKRWSTSIIRSGRFWIQL